MVMEQSIATSAAVPARMSGSIPSSPATSSPQFDPHTLGREFVRQYYTVLNKAPHLLHRFYAQDSSLIHGALNRLGDNSVDTVYGDEEISNRIISLNFRDCHAKIRQVDSLETLDKGIVVQVTGELSNDGQPMRRFFQTFVLAPRSPTNYYVRNDIFRYQDEVEVENELGEQVAPNVENDACDSSAVLVQPQQNETFPVLQPVTPKESPKPEIANGHVEVSSPKVTSTVKDIEPVEAEWEPSDVQQGDTLQKLNESNASPHPQPSGPISWASIIKKQDTDTSSAFISSLKPIVASNETGTHAPNPSPVPPSSTVAQNQISGKSPKSNEKNSRRARKQENRENTPVAPDAACQAEPADAPTALNKKMSGSGLPGAYADEQQVFVGNLPQDITEENLKHFFSKYGNILDVRINRTNQQKNANTRTPNYGFVTFDKVEIVQSILRQKPIYFNEHRFNVEEKRSQGRALGKPGMDGPRRDRNNEGGRMSGGGNMGGPGNRNDFPAGPRKDRGPIRDKANFGDKAGNTDFQQRNKSGQPGNGNANSGPRGGGGNAPRR